MATETATTLPPLTETCDRCNGTGRDRAGIPDGEPARNCYVCRGKGATPTATGLQVAELLRVLGVPTDAV